MILIGIARMKDITKVIFCPILRERITFLKPNLISFQVSSDDSLPAVVGVLGGAHTTPGLDGTASPAAAGNASPAPNLDHTYYSIDASHIYHTLDPAGGGGGGPSCSQQPTAVDHGMAVGNGRLYINRNLDLVDDKQRHLAPLFKITPPPSFSVNSAGQVKRLTTTTTATTTGKMEESEYVV